MRRSIFWLAAIAVSISTINTAKASRREDNSPEAAHVSLRIIGGHPVSIANYSYLVSMRIWGLHFCGGSIISKRVVLTAAHCFKYEKNARKYSIQYGVTQIGGTKNIIHASRLRKHPKFKHTDSDYDVGLIFLVHAIPLGVHAHSIALATRLPKTGSPANIAGWGTIEEDGNELQHLQAVIVHTLARAECSTNYKDYIKITPRMLCAGEPIDGRDTCAGDSGGPLVVGGVQAGIVSFGTGCGHKEYPGVYTNVAALHSWIEKNIK
ncbi:trypsin alpha-3-like [Anastrepha ludens]|uniref:trypsin alpha-3-like n=1 Tax=Anastrepha ludens TaxID=28586 RepID=UPI0023B08EF2|nr:trypsin alpha-3-like [Anastrepha ludens]